MALSKQWQKVIENSPPFPRNNKDGKKILFATSYGQSKYLIAIQTSLAACLKIRGMSPYFLVCDESLPACEWNKWGNMKTDLSPYEPSQDDPDFINNNCILCTDQLIDVFSNFNFPIIRFSSVSVSGHSKMKVNDFKGLSIDESRDYYYKDIAVGSQAVASVIRSLKMATLDDNEYTRWLLRRYLLAAINIVDYGEKIIDEIKPDRIILPHGVYVTHGTLLLLANKIGIPTFVHGANYRLESLTIVKNQSYHLSFFSLNESDWNKPLGKSDRKKIMRYFKSRETGEKDHTTYYKKTINSKEKLKKEFNIDENKPIVSLFTNVVWDAQINYRVNVFNNMLEWLFSEIDHFINRKDVQLIIRIHPSETRGVGTKQPVLDEIKKRYSFLPDHIIIIKSESIFSSYTLCEISKASLVYCTLLGLEIVMRGTPVIVAGESVYRGKGFTYDINSIDDFNYYNNNILDLARNTEEMIEKALRFGHYYFFKATIDYPLVVSTDLHKNAEPKLTFKTIKELMPGRYHTVDSLCKSIIENIHPAELV